MAEKKANWLVKYLTQSFIAGLTIIIPLYLTVYIVEMIVSSFDKLVDLLPPSWVPTELIFPGLGVIIACLASILAGVFVRNYIGKYFVQGLHGLVESIPVVAGIYRIIRQVAEAVLSENGQSFKKAVLVEWPRKECWMIAFVTGEPSGLLKNSLPKSSDESRYISIFLPTTPNPTSGFYFLVKETDVIELDISIEQAFKNIVSAGSLPMESFSRMPVKS